MKKVLNKSRWFKLTQETNRNGRKFYRISVFNFGWGIKTIESIRDLVDPLRNKSGRDGWDWKYSNRKDAEQVYVMLLIRWP